MCRKFSFLVFLMFCLLLCGMTQALSIDVTVAGDPVKGVPDDGDWPAGEAPPFTIDDNVNTKYLHFKGHLQPTGFAVTPRFGGKVVTEITFTTANDSPHRDPVSFELHGSNTGINGPWTLIASGDIVDFAQADPWPRFTKNATPITFANAVAYDHYQVLFTAVRDPAANNYMQIAEVELLADVTPIAGWGSKDIGNPGIPGKSFDDAGIWTIQGSGHDIWGNNDGFHYVYRPLAGDGSLQVNLVSMDVTSAWAKVGPAIREDLTAGSKHAMTAMTGSNGIQFVWRLNTNGGSDGVTRASETWPKELRMTRSGNEMISEFNYEWLPGLFMWTEIGRIAVPMNPDVTIGVVVCATNNGALNTAVLDNIILTAPPYEKPWSLSPPDGATSLPVTQTLSWMPGDSAATHDVYLGTDPAALPLVATQALGNETYTPPADLMPSTVYYWQVVEQPLGAAGPVMSFKTERTGFGEIDYCVWYDIGGTLVTDLTNNPRYPDDPDECSTLTALEAPHDFADNYGAEIKGILSPETSGNYTFWIASDDYSQLWLSTSEKSCEAQLIAAVNGWTSFREYDKYADQKSVSIPLEADKKYFVHAIMKEGGGGDSMSVAWEGPDAPSRTEVAGKFLMGGYVDNWASNLSIPDGQTLTPLEAEILSWSPGAGAVAHNVYLGTDPAAMALVASVAMPDTSLNLGILAEDTYYLRVDADDGTEIAEGCPISFSISEWVSLDIGRANPNPAGSATYDPGTDIYTLQSGGNELWGNSDEFHYYFTTMKMTRDTGAIQARVLSIDAPSSWRRGGVQIRESRAANAAKVMAHKTGHDNLRMQWRDYTGAGTGASGDNYGLGFPYWVRLERDGNVFNGFRSADGVNWTQLGSRTVTMTNDYVCVGLALCHHNSQPQDQLTTGTFDNLTITTPDPRQAWGLDPEDGATMVDIHAVLRWNAGEGATEHRVYFSADEEAVVNRTVDPVVLPAETTELAVGPLDLGKVYYWCVDEVVNPVVPGEVVSFTAEEYRTIDDFEAYDPEPEAIPEQQFIPGEIIVEAVPPPDQAWVEPQVLVGSIDPGTDCLVSQWEFEGDFTDSVGGNHGTPMGDATIVTDAQRGDVLSLDGSGDYVNIDGYKGINAIGGVQQPFTISNWFKTTSNAEMVTWGTNAGRQRLSWRIDGGRLRTEHGSGNLRGNTTVNDGEWHHGALVVNEGANLRVPNTLLYVDGQQDTTSGGSDNPYELTAGADVSIGRRATSNDRFFNGQLDDVRIYDCALTAENIRFLAGLGDLVKPGYYGPCIAHYNFDEGSGDVAADSSGNGLDGAITGAAWVTTTADGSAACLDFEAGANVVNEDAAPYLNNLAGMSISMWIQSDVIDTDQGFFIGRDPEGNDQRGIRYDTVGASAGGDDVIKFGVACSDGADESESSVLIQKTDWEHVIVTWDNDGTGTELWINGVRDILSADGTNRTGLTSGYTKILIGKGSKDGAADAGWDGRIDDVRIYDYRLSEGEVRYLAGVGNIKLPDSFVPMIGEWKMETDFSDTSGNNNNGTAIGDAAIVADAERGNVGAFDADGDAVNVGASELFNPIDDITISVWVNLNSWAGSWSNVIVGKRGEGGQGWQLRRFSGEDRFSWTTRGIDNDDYPASNLRPAFGQWYHLAAVRDGTEKRLYIDGVLDSTAAVNSNQITPCPHDVYIGARANGGNTGPEAFYDGKVDDLRIYNTALTLGQIRTLANYTSTNPISAVWSGRAAAAPALQYLDGAHEGSKCMRVEYTGSGAVTRLEPFGDGKHPHGWNGDFSLGRAQALTLYFKGDPENAPGTLFAQLTTVVPSGHTQRVLYNGDPEDLLMPDWKEWNISLHDLSTGKPADPIEEMGLPITKIKDVGVGVIGAGGGVVYFDDLRLYPVRCVPEYGPAKDLDNDCDVDKGDLRELIGDWEWKSNPGVNGVRYEYYEDYFDGLNDFDARAAIPTRAGVKANFDISGHREDGFGYRFLAKVAAPEDGYYNFHTSSDDGSKLYIDGIQVVDNDGYHGMQWRSGTKYLTAGLHDIMVTMFEWGGGQGLQVEVDGPGIPRMPIPNEVLFLPDAPDADLNGDGIVNFLDYADILNSFVDAVLWPSGEDLL